MQNSKLQQVSFPLPLVNQVSILSKNTWGEALNYVAESLHRAGQKIDVTQPLTLNIRDFYVATYPIDHFDFSQSQEKWSELFTVNRTLYEPNDRSDEIRLSLDGLGLKAYFYEFKGLVCFSIGPAQHMDGSSVLRGHFQFPCTQVEISATDFIRFMEIMEGVFLRRHTISQLRILMTIRLAGAAILVKTYHSEILMPHMEKAFSHVPRKKTISIFKAIFGSDRKLDNLLAVEKLRY